MQQAPPREKSPSNARAVILTVLAIVAAAAIGILVTSLLFSKDDNNGQAGSSLPTSSNSKAVADTTIPSPTTTTETTTETTTTTTTKPAEPTEQDYINAVRTYYAMLPANHDGGWAMLSEKARKKSQGRASYDTFLDSLASVQVIEATAQGNRVHATISSTPRPGTPRVRATSSC